MKQVQWKLKRVVVENPQAQSHWDQAYQLLLEHFASQTHKDKMDIDSEGEEVKFDENWSICQGFQPAAGSEPNHRTTIGPSQNPLSVSKLAVE